MSKDNKFYYFDISEDKIKPGETNMFYKLYFLLNDQKDDAYGNHSFDIAKSSYHAKQFGTIKTDDLRQYTASDGANNTSAPRRVLPIKYSSYDIIDFISTKKRVITIQPTDDEKEAIKAVLEYLKNWQESIYIGQLFFFEANGFTGFNINITNNKIGFVSPIYSDFVQFDIKKGTDYSALFKKFFIYTPGKFINDKEEYAGSLKKTFGVHAQNYSKNLKNEVDANKTTIDSYSLEIKKLAPKVVAANRAKKGIDDFKKSIPREFVPIFEIGEKETFKVLKQNSDLLQAYKSYMKYRNEKKAMADFAKKQQDEVGGDIKAVKKLIGKGFVSSVDFDPKLGVFWVYPSQVYEYANKKYFLGRIKMSIPPGGSIKIEMLSYPKDDKYGTLHFTNAAGYCLGSFQPIISQLLGTYRLSELIILMHKYIHSANPDSPYHLDRRDWNAMDILNPRVIDDSYIEWCKSQAKELEEAKK